MFPKGKTELKSPPEEKFFGNISALSAERFVLESLKNFLYTEKSRFQSVILYILGSEECF